MSTQRRVGFEVTDLGANRYFRDQQLMHPGVTDQFLLLWYFEDWLKKYFFSILQILEVHKLMLASKFTKHLIFRHYLLILSRIFAHKRCRSSLLCCATNRNKSKISCDC